MGIEAPLPPVQAQEVSGTAAGIAPTLPTVVSVQGIAGMTPLDVAGSLTPSGTQDVNLTEIGGVAVTTPLQVGVVGGSVGLLAGAAHIGSVDIDSLPEPVSVDDNGGSLTVDGTVAVSNFPATQPVSGAVTVSGTVAVSNLPVDDVLAGQGHAAVAVTGTAVALKSSTACKQVMVRADPGNAALLYLGTSTVTNDETAGTGGLQLSPGDAATFPVANVATTFINGTAGDGASYMYWT